MDIIDYDVLNKMLMALHALLEHYGLFRWYAVKSQSPSVYALINLMAANGLRIRFFDESPDPWIDCTLDEEVYFSRRPHRKQYK